MKDINPIDDPAASSEPSSLTAVGDVVFFFAADHAGVIGLWRTDGTQSGTRLVWETGAETELAGVGNLLFFGSCELWKADGTTVVLVKDFRPPHDYACPRISALTNVNGRLFFALDDTRGRSLWISDGTTPGTRLVKRVNAWNLLAIGNRLFFTQRNNLTGNELWTSDGTSLGTRLVKDICPGACDGVMGGDAAGVNGLLYFPGTDGVHGYRLWRSDGTRSGTRMVDEENPDAAPWYPTHLVAMGGRLFFGANDSNGEALWASDGTLGGTAPLKRVGVRATRSAAGKVFFVGWEPATGNEPWVSDGSGAGTIALGDVCPGDCDSLLDGGLLATVGDTAFFGARSASDALPVLWASDGTTSGTVLVKNVGVWPAAGATVRGMLLFLGNDGTNGFEVWKSDGTDVGTVMVTNRVSNSSCTYGPTPVNGRLFFSVCLPRDGAGLWVSDGTWAGTTPVKSFVNGPYMLTAFEGVALFTAWDGSSSALWRSDGTEAGTTKVSDVEPEGVAPYHFVLAGGKAFFTGADTIAGAELWKTDGTPSGTTMVKDIAPGPLSSFPGYLTAVNDVLFFSALSWNAKAGGYAWALWRSDGTERGTRLVKNVTATYLTDVNGTLFFVGYDPIGSTNLGGQLWKSDGTEAGTVQVKDLFSPNWLVNMNGTLFFVAADAARGYELWKSDGTTAGTVCVKDIVEGPRSSSPSLLTVVGDKLLFMACTDSQGCELWRSDGTARGTAIVKDINPRFSASGLNPAGNRGIQDLFAVQDKVFFQADDGVSGIELWESDGTDAGTHLVQDLAAGPQFSFPHNIARVGSTLFFAADDGVVGDELWALDLGPRISVWPATAVEHACQKTVANVTVTLSSASSRPVTVQYATSDGTAKAGQDYLPASGTLGFAPGVTSRVIKVPIVGDRVLEADEYFNVVLSSPAGGLLDETASTATVWIEDQPQLELCR